MRHWLVYHNPDEMEYPAEDVSELSAYTDKVVRELVGDRVWLLTGKGKPRSYYLVSTFVVAAVDASGGEGFATKASGHDGILYRPMPEVGGLPWFGELRRSQGNFAFGMQRITDQSVIAGLEKFAQR